MNQELIRAVWKRANRRCEYCHMPAEAYAGSFHVDHILAIQHGGEATLGNLALACGRCNRSKGPNLAGRDPETGEVVPLFHPRNDLWADHFEWDGADLIGKTRVGRVTIQVLGIADPVRRNVRAVLMREGSFNWD